MYDLNLLQIQTHQGEQRQQMAGLHAAAPPRRAARSRAEDLLIVSLILKGNAKVSPEIQESWLERLSQIFYRTSGSVTSALRGLVETLNLTMMENNLKNVQKGGAVVGAINLVAVHRRALYIVQSGLTHAYTLSHQGLQHFYDASQSDRGLGLSRTPTIRYYQAELGTGGYLFMTDTPPETWTEDLLFTSGFPNLDQLRRRLVNQAPADFNLGLVQILPGEGQIKNVSPNRQPARTAEAEPVEPAVSPETSEIVTPIPTSEAEIESEDVVAKSDLSSTQQIRREPLEPELRDEASDELVTAKESEPIQQPEKSALDSQTLTPHRKQSSEPGNEGGTREKKIPRVQPTKETGTAAREKLQFQKEQIREQGLKGLSVVFAWWRKTRETVSTFFKDLFGRWLPANPDGSPKLSRGTLLLIAVGVPLVVVAISVGVYLFRGRNLQYAYYFEQAQIASKTALAADDRGLARNNWAQTLEYLDQAESFKKSEEISALRNDALAALDTLDGAVRLMYQPAINGTLYSDINFTRIVSYGPDLYLFDSNGGRAIHATRASQGYEVDPDFVCAAGNFSGGGVDTLVDIVSLPINNAYQAHILGIDANGNVVYCAPGEDPLVQTLPSDGGISGAITRIVYAGNSLYVLAPSAGMLQVYWPTNGQFLDPPVDYFAGITNGQRPDLTQIVDLAVNGSDLYLLRADGMMVNCSISAGNAVNCENPVTYVDGRPGMEDQPVEMPDSTFTSVLYTSPPDPSINILDAENADIYRFSLRFRLYQRLRPDMGEYELESPIATAFTIGIDRVAFIAFGNQVFYAYVE